MYRGGRDGAASIQRHCHCPWSRPCHEHKVPNPPLPSADRNDHIMTLRNPSIETCVLISTNLRDQ